MPDRPGSQSEWLAERRASDAAAAAVAAVDALHEELLARSDGCYRGESRFRRVKLLAQTLPGV